MTNSFSYVIIFNDEENRSSPLIQRMNLIKVIATANGLITSIKSLLSCLNNSMSFFYFLDFAGCVLVCRAKRGACIRQAHALFTRFIQNLSSIDSIVTKFATSTR